MSRHDILIFVCGVLAGTVALLAVRAIRSFGRRDVEQELLGALISLRRNAAQEWNQSTEDYEAMLRRADLAIALATAEVQS